MNQAKDMNSGGRTPDGGGPATIPAARFAVLLAALFFAAFWDVSLGIRTFAVRDFGLFSYPNALFQRECFWHGELPWWNPYDCCGLPFLAQFNTLALYPPALLYLLLPLTWALPFFCLLHLFIGGMGAHRLALHWTGSATGAAVAGVAFAFNGLALNFLMWPSHAATLAWLPWIVLLTEKGWRTGGRSLAAPALLAALQVLAGGPETILFTWLILAGLLVLEWRRGAAPAVLTAGRFLLTGLLALCFSSVQWLPFVEFVLHCNRSTTYAGADWSMPASGWANFLLPMFQTRPSQGLAVQPDQYWTSSYYCGIGTLFLAALAVWRRRDARLRWLAALTGAALILALGDHGLVFHWLRTTIPWFGFFRYPIKFVILTSALLPILAAFAFAERERSAKSWQPEWICGAGMALALAVLLGWEHAHPVEAASWPAVLRNGISRLALLGGIAAALWFAAAATNRGRWAAWAVPLLCWLDLVTAVPWQNPSVDPSVYQEGLGQMTDHLAPPPALGVSRLMLSSWSANQNYFHPAQDLKTACLLNRAVFLGDCNLLDHFPKVDGFYSLYPRYTDKILRLLDGAEGARLEGLEDFLGVSQTIAPGKVYDWLPRSSYLPALSIGQAPVFAGDDAALDAVANARADFHSTIYLPETAGKSITAGRVSTARITNAKFGPNRVMLSVDTPAPAMLLIAQSYDQNWRARIDGNPVPLWRADYAYQAVEVPAGAHEIVVAYGNRLFWVGIIAATGAALVLLRLKKRTAPATVQPVSPGQT